MHHKTVDVHAATSAELATGRAPVTQFGRVCARLGIQVIAASSPQAKGRVERNHGTGQDRLVKQLRLAGIATVEGANAFLTSHYLVAHNARFAVAPANAVDAHPPVPRAWRLDDCFVLETPRVLGRDWVIRFEGRALQVTPTRAAQRRVGPGQTVSVRTRPAGPLTLVVVAPATGQESVLAWTDITGTRARPVPHPIVTAPRPRPPSRPQATRAVGSCSVRRNAPNAPSGIGKRPLRSTAAARGADSRPNGPRRHTSRSSSLRCPTYDVPRRGHFY